MQRVKMHLPAGQGRGTPFDHLTLTHHERRLRRRVLGLPGGEEILIDFPEPVTLGEGDMLELEDGRFVGIRAADEQLYSVTGRDARHVARLAWHIGNRHLPAQIEKDRILIGRDRVIRDMLIGLGASVTETVGHFAPEHGAYGHDHGPSGHLLSVR